MMKGFIPNMQYFQNCNMCRLLLLIHVVFYCSLRLAPRYPASTLVQLLKCTLCCQSHGCVSHIPLPLLLEHVFNYPHAQTVDTRLSFLHPLPCHMPLSQLSLSYSPLLFLLSQEGSCLSALSGKLAQEFWPLSLHHLSLFHQYYWQLWSQLHSCSYHIHLQKAHFIERLQYLLESF